MKKFLAILSARNKEFVRDRAALTWNFAFPLLLLVGFSFMFSDEGKALYSVGVLKSPAPEPITTQVDSSESVELTIGQAATQSFSSLKYLKFIDYDQVEKLELKVNQHKIDLAVDFIGNRYWINDTSAKGYILEQLLTAKLNGMTRVPLNGKAIRYLDWVMPGILGMNMMFSCLFGVGYVIVRYRKNGVLKRFQATPLNAFEFLSAQVISRLFIVMLVTSILFLGSHWLLNFYILGSFFSLFLIALLGAASMIAMSLLIASRSSSEEFTGGLLNFASWPMMMLSGVWFSLEGAPSIIQQIAQLFPLTHMLDAARAVIIDGAGLADVSNQLLILLAMTAVFLSLGSTLFNWGSERGI